ncbi:beta-galactosidase [Naasia sp. SYSU D00057]|uniref:beta-galactosidase n=1 Tax=Naasia sp. SYSU D00057 TaxID=2817380 RepID=UPI001B30F57C|nr:beta-galactosidase [Naasia sp. SYSU D00057]
MPASVPLAPVLTGPTRRDLSRPVQGFAFGGDYNPEQWTEDVWVEDVRLMREAGVTLVTLGVFAWGSLELADGEWDFAWLDRVLELLHEGGIAVDLATPTASPPIWLHQEHPEILPVNRSGQRYWQGGRLGWCASSAVWRRYALRAVTTIGERYAAHPAVRMWHVGNEFGGGNRHCYCDASAEHFRSWLERRYGTVDGLNTAWGTAFWGHRYSSFAQVLPPRDSESAQNPGLLLDFDRFSSDALLEHYVAERDALRELSPDLPITTNFMVGSGPGVIDHASWAPHVDVVANDHYTLAADPERAQELAFSADRTRGLDRMRPWLLMEHSTSAVNWQPRNRSKAPGELVRNSLSHVARGSDGALFFQWRASTAGSEQWHSGMVPHAGTDTKVWREVAELGRILAASAEVAGSLVEPARVALLADDVAGWAWQAGQKPLHGLPAFHAAREWHRTLWHAGVLCDVLPRTASLEDYSVILVPAVYLVEPELARGLEAAARGGATVLVTYASGLVDESNRVIRGGYPGALRDLVGAAAEEFFVLQDGECSALEPAGTVTTWTELVQLRGAEAVRRYRGGVLDGEPALTRRRVGMGEAWYVSARLDDEARADLLGEVLAGAGVTASVPVAPGLEAVRRTASGRSWLFLINHGDEDVRASARGTDLVTGAPFDGVVPGGTVRIVREEPLS